MNQKAARFELSEKELRRIAERMIAEGRMPSREEVEKKLGPALREEIVKNTTLPPAAKQ